MELSLLEVASTSPPHLLAIGPRWCFLGSDHAAPSSDSAGSVAQPHKGAALTLTTQIVREGHRTALQRIPGHD
jgi:hypothetical protein